YDVRNLSETPFGKQSTGEIASSSRSANHINLLILRKRIELLLQLTHRNRDRPWNSLKAVLRRFPDVQYCKASTGRQLPDQILVADDGRMYHFRFCLVLRGLPQEVPEDASL